MRFPIITWCSSRGSVERSQEPGSPNSRSSFRPAFPLGPWTYPFGLGESPVLPSSWPWRPPPRSSTWLRAVTRPVIVENAPACLRLGSVGSQGYLAVVQSASDIGAARFDYTFTGLREGGVLAAPGGGSVPSIRMRQGPLWELGCLTPCSSRLGLVRARSGTTSSPSLAREIWRCRSARGERTYRW